MRLLQRIDELDKIALASTCAQSDAPRLVLEYISAIGSAKAHEAPDLAPIGAMHPWPWVRVAALRHLAHMAPTHSGTRKLTEWLTHDYDDFVAFEALQVAGLIADEDTIAHLMLIVGEASKRITHHSGKPVGIGHAVALEAIQAIAHRLGRGESGPQSLADLQDKLFPEGRPAQPAPPEIRTCTSRTDTKDHGRHDGMAFVPGGEVIMGVPRQWESAGLLFDWNDDPRTTVPVPGFHIDLFPVTVGSYDAFAASEAARNHAYCHPSEAPGKIHWRNTLTDPRVAADHPVTGVDWFDAYAFASWSGKRLPVEAEWQRAAQGSDGRAFPWGREFDPAQAHCIGDLDLSRGWTSVQEWRTRLMALLEEPTLVTTRAVAARGTSPFGVHDMSGNCWEWTASAYSGASATPGDGARDALDVVYDPTSYAVIKGGAWTSLPEQASAAFRGRDLLFDRHFEIGFRCVCDCAAS
ncbi:formylglycine-generating enzyme family protein [Streptomyces sp. NBC_01214]|uniref:formylglycine-generating enzyme family protein n=2 Tax=unclassified Streptomyces TaxID=2593676 RepID=UPI00224F45D3|nr:SUMF1/EgtB/PvdO family nonheme iron enzyme [Streptomyces sp. NBC_01214]MCX4804443.1 formylglycine-generating enzyme family protein [Streptomyces sp. NBC_01214]